MPTCNGLSNTIPSAFDISSNHFYSFFFQVRAAQIFCTTLVSFALIIGGGFVIAYARKSGPELSGVAITVFNLVTPRVVGKLASYESHPDQSSFSASQYVKMTAFRWTNTALVITIITPFTDSLQNGAFLIASVYTMFYYDLTLTPVMQILDIFGNPARHFFGPRKTDQRKMNLSFQASHYDIGERYTNVTRILFFALFYSTLFPAGFFFASAVFIMSYWLDKFSILRSWSQGPKIGTKVSKISNNMFLLCLATYAIMSSYNFARFPFDNACAGEDIDNGYYGSWDVVMSSGSTEQVEISSGNLEYKFCSQDLMRRFAFLPSQVLTGSDWMNGSQDTYAQIYAFFGVVVVALTIGTILLWTISRTIYKLFFIDFQVSISFSQWDVIRSFVHLHIFLTSIIIVSLQPLNQLTGSKPLTKSTLMCPKLL